MQCLWPKRVFLKFKQLIDNTEKKLFLYRTKPSTWLQIPMPAEGESFKTKTVSVKEIISQGGT